MFSILTRCRPSELHVILEKKCALSTKLNIFGFEPMTVTRCQLCFLGFDGVLQGNYKKAKQVTLKLYEQFSYSFKIVQP